MGVGFENTCTASGKRNISGVIPSPCRWVDNTFKFSYILAENSLVVRVVVSQPGDSRSIPREGQFSILLL